jgi:hypothetical protein
MSSIPFHDVALTPLLLGLRNAHHFISKGQTHAQTQSHPESEYTTASLHPDMKDLIYQIQRFTDIAKFIPERINPTNPTLSLPDTETTFPEALARVQRTIEYLESIEASTFEGREEAEVVMKNGGKEWKMSGREYVLKVAQPNFWFHVTTTYGILRMKGVDVGKMDFLVGGKASV